jgi:ABC-type multidrug transport system permease subunit
MNLFRSLADAGKTVVCITHSLANVERTCHLVVILTAGGKLAFIGKPAEALAYFRIDRLGDVYDRMAEQTAEHWQSAFLHSEYWRRYVAERMPAGADDAAPNAPGGSSRRAGEWLPTLIRQTMLTTRRYAAIWRGDYPSLLAMMGQALVVAVLLGLLFGDISKITEERDHASRAVNLMFLLAISSFWFGCNNAAKELVKERTIYTRERDFNLLVSSYFSSKILLLTLFSAIQTVALFAIVRSWCTPPGAALPQLAVLLALALAGVSIGLAISALAASEEMAITLIPMVVIPQIILSGAIVPLDGVSKWLGQFAVATYWGKRGLDAGLPANLVRAIGLDQHSTAFALLVLLAHACVAIGLALAVLHWQNRRR